MASISHHKKPDLPPTAKLLSSLGIRPSKARVRILDYLNETGGHPTADDILHGLADMLPPISRATVYNTINLLVQHGLLRTPRIDRDHIRYDSMRTAHGHFLCRSCGQIRDFAVNLDIIPSDELVGCRIDDKDFAVMGICPCCATVNQPAASKKRDSKEGPHGRTVQAKASRPDA